MDVDDDTIEEQFPMKPKLYINENDWKLDQILNMNLRLINNRKYSEYESLYEQSQDLRKTLFPGLSDHEIDLMVDEYMDRERWDGDSDTDSGAFYD